MLRPAGSARLPRASKVGKGLTSLVYIGDEQRSGDGPWADKAEPVDEQADSNMRFAMVLDGLDALGDRERFAIVERCFREQQTAPPDPGRRGQDNRPVQGVHPQPRVQRDHQTQALRGYPRSHLAAEHIA